MPLQDHFHPPLHGPRQWHAFHHAWATYLASYLNQRLPEGYYAEPNIQFGIEIDVAALEEPDKTSTIPMGEGYTPPGPALSAPLTLLTDVVEVTVASNMGGLVLVGAIELVSPSNKHGPAERGAFVSKCAGYLQQGAGLIVVDIVTERRGNLHDDLLRHLQTGAPRFPAELYASAYRPVLRQGKASVDIWQEALAIGTALPTLPLWLQKEICLPVDLEATYSLTCRELRITANGV